jgi:hypothetical protein
LGDISKLNQGFMAAAGYIQWVINKIRPLFKVKIL